MKMKHRLSLWETVGIWIARIIAQCRTSGENGNFYINGPDVLPPPLSAEEEAEAISRLGWDEGAVSSLIEHNLRLVVYIARKFENTGIGLEDLISIGTIGLIKAIRTYRAEKNIKLATYASRCIENEILMFLLLFCKQITVVILESCSLPLVKKTLAGSVCSRGGSPHPHFLTPCANAMCLPRFAAQAAFATNTAQKMRGKRWDSYKLNGIFQSKCA